MQHYNREGFTQHKSADSVAERNTLGWLYVACRCKVDEKSRFSPFQNPLELH